MLTETAFNLPLYCEYPNKCQKKASTTFAAKYQYHAAPQSTTAAEMERTVKDSLDSVDTLNFP